MSFEERLAGLFQPHTVLPAQYFDSLRRRTEFDGERRLMLAILEDAVDCYRKHVAARDHRARQLFTEAESWIESEDSSWLFSFQNICDVLGFESDYLRNGLRNLKTAARAPRPSRVVQIHADHFHSDHAIPTDSAEPRQATAS